jgi:hypothetical protein
MTRRPFRFLAAALGSIAVLAVAAPAAHASGPPQAKPTAWTGMSCKKSGGPGLWPSWHVDLGNEAGASADAHFIVLVNAKTVEDKTLAPGQSQSYDIGAPADGFQTTIEVFANNVEIEGNTQTPLCNPPTASITAQGCEVIEGVNMGRLWFSELNYATKKSVFVAHWTDGTDHVNNNVYQSAQAVYALNGQPYDVWITIDGVKKAELTGTANCPPVPPTTTTTQPPVTTTTVRSAQVDPPASTPTTAHHATTVAATQTLPFTGGSSLPLGIAGFALVGGGSALLLGLRRRQSQA